MTRLAAEQADGVIFHIFTPPRDPPLPVEAGGRGALRAIRPLPGGMGRPVAVHEDLEQALEMARLELAGVLSVPRFGPRLVELRGADLAASVLDPLRKGNTAAAIEGIDDALVREFITVAEPDRIVSELAGIGGGDGRRGAGPGGYVRSHSGVEGGGWRSAGSRSRGAPWLRRCSISPDCS